MQEKRTLLVQGSEWVLPEPKLTQRLDYQSSLGHRAHRRPPVHAPGTEKACTPLPPRGPSLGLVEALTARPGELYPKAPVLVSVLWLPHGAVAAQAGTPAQVLLPSQL